MNQFQCERVQILSCLKYNLLLCDPKVFGLMHYFEYCVVIRCMCALTMIYVGIDVVTHDMSKVASTTTKVIAPC
jgi:hypothetical protein